jgi:hypothetical protein
VIDRRLIIRKHILHALSFFLLHYLCHALGESLPSGAVVCVAQPWCLRSSKSWMLVVHLGVRSPHAAVWGPAIQLLQAN